MIEVRYLDFLRSPARENSIVPTVSHSQVAHKEKLPPVSEPPSVRLHFKPVEAPSLTDLLRVTCAGQEILVPLKV